MIVAKRSWSSAVAALLFLATSAQAQTLTDADRSAIRALMGSYARALGECRAEDFADLFTPTGWFASGFRGHMAGRERLIKLVQSERHCIAPPAAGAAARPGGSNGPTVAIEATPAGARGIANLGTAEYQDEYVKTAGGWRFASRTVIIGPEKAAGLDANELLAISRLNAGKLGDHYEPDANGVPRLMASGIRVNVSGTEVKGRAFLKDGGYDEQVYEKVAPGQWRVKSSVHVAASN